MTSKTLVAALVCLTSLSAPALALDIGIGASAGGGASASSGSDGGLSLGLGTNVSIGANANLGLASNDSTAASLAANASGAASLTGSDELDQVIALIDASTWTDTSLSTLTEVSATAYDVNAWVNSSNQAALDLALSGNAGEIADLQAAVSANATLESWLEANNATASEVIAIGVAADGSLAVFTN